MGTPKGDFLKRPNRWRNRSKTPRMAWWEQSPISEPDNLILKRSAELAAIHSLDSPSVLDTILQIAVRSSGVMGFGNDRVYQHGGVFFEPPISVTRSHGGDLLTFQVVFDLANGILALNFGKQNLLLDTLLLQVRHNPISASGHTHQSGSELVFGISHKLLQCLAVKLGEGLVDIALKLS